MSLETHTQLQRPRAECADGIAINETTGLVTKPFFLVGSERSGTTLTRLMFDHHPLIAFFFEFEYAVDMMPESEGWPDLREYYEFLRPDRIFQAANVVIDEKLDYPHLVDSFLRRKRDRDNKPLVGATVHRHFDRLLRIWPDARFIHIVRDGRDVARSVIEMGWAGNMYTAVEGWIEAEMLWSRLCRDLPADRWTEIRYEALVSRPEATLTRVCEFLGVPYDPAMLDYHKYTTYGPPSPKASGQWKFKLSPDEIRLAEARIRDMLTERDYELSGHSPLEVSPAMARWLRLHNRCCRAMFRRRRYGLGLFLAQWVTRRFGPRSWQLRVQERINVIDTKYLK
ncbi:MAG TPA: sulfotransferase [Isosphaeraceae bacterium]|nr:sulfotransferase [Isosphaeraceae bacterium]